MLGSYVSVRLRMCVYVYECIRAVSPSVSACVSSSDERKKERMGAKGVRGRTGRTERRGRIRARVGDQACVYTETARARRRRGWEEGEINVFVLRPPSYAPGERRLAALARRSHGEADGRDDVARLHVEYQPSVIAFVCKGRLFPSLPPSLPLLRLLHLPPLLNRLFFHPSPPCRSIALVVSSRRVYAPISRFPTCRCDST